MGETGAFEDVEENDEFSVFRQFRADFRCVERRETVQ